MTWRLAGEQNSQLALDDEQHALGASSGSGRSLPPPGATSTMYCENVSAKPDSGRDSTQTRVLSQNGKAAGHDVLHHAFGDDGIGFGEDRAAGQQLALAGVAAMRRVVGSVRPS